MSTAKPKDVPKAETASKKSQDHSSERDQRTPGDFSEIVGKIGTEARGEKGAWEKVKAVGREADRLVGGEYERRDNARARRE